MHPTTCSPAFILPSLTMTLAGSSSSLGSATTAGSGTHLSAGGVAGLVIALLVILAVCLVLILRCFGFCYCCGERKRTCVGRRERGEKEGAEGWA